MWFFGFLCKKIVPFKAIMSAKLAPAGGIDWGIVLASVLVVDVLHEQQHIVLVLDGSHAASQFIAGLSKGRLVVGFFDCHLWESRAICFTKSRKRWICC